MSTPTNRTVNIYINHDKAEASLKKLQAQTQKLKADIVAGEKAGKDMSKSIEELGKKKAQIEQLSGVISGKMAPSLTMVRQRVRELRNELQHMSADAPGYAAKFESFKKASAHLKEMESAAKGVGNVIQSKFSKFMSNVGSIALGTIIGNTVQAGIQKIGAYLSGLVSGNAELSDSLADIEKTTGMTTEQVAKLNSELGKLDTRTKTKELREIAIALGQLGQEATPEAVASIDRIVVALGDEFGGGANEITKALSILRNNLGDIKTNDYGTDVLKIGNALNVLGAEGLATAPVVTDIANRIAGVGQTFGVTSGQILGVAATFQELGISEERGATAFIRLLQRMTQNVDEYAKIAELAGVKSKDFATLVNTDIVAALAKVAEGAKIAGKDNVAFGQVLKDLEADGSGAGEVLSKLSQNSVLLTEKVGLATKALGETNSITDEFNKKNNNLAGTLEKIEKKMHSAFVNSTIMKGINGMVNGFAKMIGVIDPVQDRFDRFKAAEQKVKDLELSIAPLVDRYEALKEKSALSNAEQDEMNQLIKEIARLVPTAATEIDSYGRALDISTEKVKNYTAAHRAMLKVQNEDLIKDVKQRIANAQEELKLAEMNRKSIAKETELSQKQIDRAIQEGRFDPDFRIKSLTAVDNKIDLIKEKLLGLRTQLEELTGESSVTPKQGSVLSNVFGLNVPDFTVGIKKSGIGSTTTSTTSTGGDDKHKDPAALLREFQLLKAEVDALAADETQKLTAEQEKQLVAVSNKYLALAEKAKEYKITLAGLTETQEKEITALQQKFAKERAAHDYADRVKGIQEFHAQEKQLLLQRLADGEITEQEHFALSLKMEQQHNLDRLAIAETYIGESEQAERDAQNAQTQALQDGINERDRLSKQGYRDRMALLELNVLTARKGSKDELEARRAVLQEQFEQETAQMDRNSAEYLLKQEQFQAESGQLEADWYSSRLNMAIQFVGQLQNVFQMWHDFQQQNMDAAHKKEMNRLDEEGRRYQKLLEDKKISQTRYDQKTAELEEKKRQTEQKHALEAFEQEKKAKIAAINMSAAQAIMAVWAQNPNPVYGGIMSGVIGGIAAVQIGMVASQEFPELAKGGRLKGPKHSEGGIDMIDSHTGRKVAEAEGGEVVLSAATVANNADIVDRLLYASQHQNGRKLPDWMFSRPAAIRADLYAQAVNNRMMANGGYVSTASGTGPSFNSGYASQPASIDTGALLKFAEAVERFERMSEKGLKAHVYANETDRQNQELNRIKDRSRMA